MGEGEPPDFGAELTPAATGDAPPTLKKGKLMDQVSPSHTRNEELSDADNAVAAAFATRHGLAHEHNRDEIAHQWDKYPFGVGSWRRVRHVVHGSLFGRSVTAFEYHYLLLSSDQLIDGTDRESLHRFLVCVIDLEHSVPGLAALRNDWLEWHPNTAEGQAIDVANERWTKFFTLSGRDLGFARAVVNEEHAARCAELEISAEWRFSDDELLLWIKNGRVDKHLLGLVDIARPLVEAAERYEPAVDQAGK